MTDTAINAGLRIALEQVNGALRSHGIEPSGDYGADIERLATDADRWRYLVAENNKGMHGRFRICWIEDGDDGFTTTAGVSVNGKDEQAIVRIVDEAKAKGHSL